MRDDPGQVLADELRQELSDYSLAWIMEHLQDDHLITLDHKDEMGLMRTLLVLRDALERYERLTR